MVDHQVANHARAIHDLYVLACDRAREDCTWFHGCRTVQGYAVHVDRRDIADRQSIHFAYINATRGRSSQNTDACFDRAVPATVGLADITGRCAELNTRRLYIQQAGRIRVQDRVASNDCYAAGNRFQIAKRHVASRRVTHVSADPTPTVAVRSVCHRNGTLKGFHVNRPARQIPARMDVVILHDAVACQHGHMTACRNIGIQDHIAPAAVRRQQDITHRGVYLLIDHQCPGNRFNFRIQTCRDPRLRADRTDRQSVGFVQIDTAVRRIRRNGIDGDVQRISRRTDIAIRHEHQLIGDDIDSPRRILRKPVRIMCDRIRLLIGNRARSSI